MWTSSIRSYLIAIPVGILLACLAIHATAAIRLFPPTAKRGTLAITEFPTVLMNGKPRKLSPGAKIRNTDNLIQVHGSLGDSKYIVNYTDNEQGDIDRIWLLTVEEARQPAPKKVPPPELPAPRPIQTVTPPPQQQQQQQN